MRASRVRKVRLAAVAGLLGFIVAGAGTSVVARAAAAQWRPDRNVEIIVGTGPGGGQDKTARTLQRILQDKRLIDVPGTVVNKPGGGGAVGWTYLNAHAGDGHYLEIGNVTLLTNQIVGRSVLHYTDVTPIAILFSEAVAFSVRQDSPIKNGADLVARLRKDAGSVSVSVGSSLGSANHIALALVAKAAGADVRKLKTVVFQGGGEAMTALLGGHVDMITAAANNVVPHIVPGTLRVIGITAPLRLAGVLAQAPTWREQGIDALATNWRLLAGPKAMTAAQIAYWDGVTARLTQTEEWKQDLERNEFENTYLGSADSARYLKAEYEHLKAVLSAVGLAK